MHKITFGGIVFEETIKMSNENLGFLFGLFLIALFSGLIAFFGTIIASAFRRRGGGCLTNQLTAYPHDRGRLMKNL